MTLVLRIENFDQLDNGGPTWIRLEYHGASVGRRGGMDWVLPDPSKTISGHHFDISYQDGAYWITDVSTNGTYPHGQRHRLAGPLRLGGGERFVVGHYIILAELHVSNLAPEPEPEPIPVAPAMPYAPEPPMPMDEPEDPWDAVGGPLDPVETKQRPGGLSRPRVDDAGSAFIPVQRPGVQSAPTQGGTSGLQVPRFPQGGLPRHSGIQAPEWTWGPAPLEPSTPQPPFVPEPPPAPSEPPYVPQSIPQAPAPPNDPYARDPAPDHRSIPPQPPAEPRAVPQPSLEPYRPAPRPPEVSAPPYSPPPAPRPRPEAGQPQAPRPGVGGGDAQAALRAFCEGAGLDPSLAANANSAEVMFDLGRSLRGAVDEIMLMLRSRDDVKAFTRGGTRTMLSATANNPMKFLPDSLEALEAMFFSPRPGFMDGPEAFDDALKDVRLHQEAIFRALQPALREVFKGLSPDEIEAAAEGSGNLLGGGRKGRHWGLYVERWDAKAQVGENGILDAFLQAFARTYAQASARDGSDGKKG
ncbi:type VI secretion system-associated FHA domain protein TagH [Thetidibacter halocola]|uniref:Type VI secretion system-associated FHA domain protein TagH n=1 Tax=Thetidibacter halocola TaxID=2827239 RepID=A0A8J7WDW9_9RHOB|nr:type VI secretion system-associated FHA domain protein TagH [Thetidibacter halocola]MBS0123566.1 type VI secretion system-associated FHA domain protein TagH [Thetidibacter halocola]